MRDCAALIQGRARDTKVPMSTVERLPGKVLLTGASGFIGSRLRDALLEGGSDVIALRRRGSPEPRRGRSVVAEYHDVDALRRIVAEERPDFVLHVAGVTKGVRYDDFRRGNVMPTENLLRALREGHPGTRRFVLVSSLTSYGPTTKDRPLRESDARRPIEYYGRSKLEAELAVESEKVVPWTIVRPAGIYGPGDVDYLELFRAAHRRVNLFFGNRERLGNHLFVDDCVRGILRASHHERAVGEGYFLTHDLPLSWGELQDHIVRVMPHKVFTVSLPEQLVTLAAIGGELATRIDGKPRLLNRQKAVMGAAEAWICRGDKAREELGFEPIVHHEEGVRRTHGWYRAQGWY